MINETGYEYDLNNFTDRDNACATECMLWKYIVQKLI